MILREPGGTGREANSNRLTKPRIHFPSEESTRRERERSRKPILRLRYSERYVISQPDDNGAKIHSSPGPGARELMKPKPTRRIRKQIAELVPD